MPAPESGLYRVSPTMKPQPQGASPRLCRGLLSGALWVPADGIAKPDAPS